MTSETDFLVEEIILETLDFVDSSEGTLGRMMRCTDLTSNHMVLLKASCMCFYAIEDSITAVH